MDFGHIILVTECTLYLYHGRSKQGVKGGKRPLNAEWRGLSPPRNLTLTQEVRAVRASTWCREILNSFPLSSRHTDDTVTVLGKLSFPACTCAWYFSILTRKLNSEEWSANGVKMLQNYVKASKFKNICVRRGIRPYTCFASLGK